MAARVYHEAVASTAWPSGVYSAVRRSSVLLVYTARLLEQAVPMASTWNSRRHPGEVQVPYWDPGATDSALCRRVLGEGSRVIGSSLVSVIHIEMYFILLMSSLLEREFIVLILWRRERERERSSFYVQSVKLMCRVDASTFFFFSIFIVFMCIFRNNTRFSSLIYIVCVCVCRCDARFITFFLNSPRNR